MVHIQHYWLLEKVMRRTKTWKDQRNLSPLVVFCSPPLVTILQSEWWDIFRSVLGGNLSDHVSQDPGHTEIWISCAWGARRNKDRDGVRGFLHKKGERKYLEQEKHKGEKYYKTKTAFGNSVGGYEVVLMWKHNDHQWEACWDQLLQRSGHFTRFYPVFVVLGCCVIYANLYTSSTLPMISNILVD